MINMEERRRFQRYPIYCPIEYKCEDSQPRKASITINISEGGALISAENLIEVATNLIIKIYFKNHDFFVKARVVHVQNGIEGDPFKIGVEFLESSLNFIRKFYEELETIMFYQRRYSKESARPISLTEASMRWYKTSPG